MSLDCLHSGIIKERNKTLFINIKDYWKNKQQMTKGENKSKPKFKKIKT